MKHDVRSLDLSRDQQIWGMALWVERVHGENGWFHIATEQDRLLAEGDFDGVALWRHVQRCWKQLREDRASIN